MKAKRGTFSKLEFDNYKSLYEGAGYTVLTRWRKGCQLIKLADIVLSERKSSAAGSVTDATDNALPPPGKQNPDVALL